MKQQERRVPSGDQWTLRCEARLFPLLITAALPTFTVFLFLPFDTYQLNWEEISVGPALVWTYLVTPALLITSVVVGLGLLLAGKLYRRFLAVVFAVGFLLWLEGNFVLWKYGLLDGTNIDWSRRVWQGWTDGVLWLAALALAVLCHKRVSRIAPLVSGVLLCSQLATVGFVLVGKPEIWRFDDSQPKSEFEAPAGIYEFSSRLNIIHVVFDGLRSGVFQSVTEIASEHYTSEFDGFYFFPETVGVFPTTYLSVPAFLGESIYRNNVPKSDFLDRALRGRTITRVAFDHGFEVDVVTATPRFFVRDESTLAHFYKLPTRYIKTPQDEERLKVAQLLDLALFRALPHFLKRAVYNDQSWLFQKYLTDRPWEQFAFFAHTTFFERLIDSMKVADRPPVYKLVHLLSTHPPYIVQSNGKYSGRALIPTRENIDRQARVSVDQFVRFLNRLRELGIYDSSLILFHADHGQSMGGVPLKEVPESTAAGGDKIDRLRALVGYATPLMALKPPGSTGPLTTSSAQTSLTDVPATVSAILNLNTDFGGRSMLEIDEDEVRERRFLYYEYYNWNYFESSDYVRWIDEYRIEGSVLDARSWQIIDTHLPPGSMYRPSESSTGQGEGRDGELARGVGEYSLREDRGVIAGPDGSTIDLTPGAVVGRVDLVMADPKHVALVGWAVDLDGGRDIQAIAIFEDGTFVHSSATDDRCPNTECQRLVQEALRRFSSPEAELAGFRVDMPISMFEQFDRSIIRVFAIGRGGVASKLADPGESLPR